MPRVSWSNLSDRELMALHILVIFKEVSIDEVCTEMGFSRGSFFNKIGGKNKFKAVELERLLKILEITIEELKEASETSLITLIQERKKEKTKDSTKVN